MTARSSFDDPVALAATAAAFRRALERPAQDPQEPTEEKEGAQ